MKKNFFLLPIVLLLVSCGPQTFNYSSVQPPLSQLVVQAEAQVKVNPDQLQLRLGVVSEAETADLAMMQNNQRMSAVMQTLAEIGITETEMATGQFQIRPEWSRPPRPTPANWQRAIVGYRISNELLITSSQVALAGKLLTAVQQAGANQVGGLQFGLLDTTAHKQTAIEIATQKAIRKAQTLATAAGVKLGAIQSINLNPGAGGPQPRLMMAEARMASAEPVPVAAGQVEVSAAVTIVYQIENVSGGAE